MTTPWRSRFCQSLLIVAWHVQRQLPCSMYDRQDVDAIFADSVDDPVRMLQQFSDRLILILRHCCPELRKLSQLLRFSRDPIHQSLGVSRRVLGNRLYPE